MTYVGDAGETSATVLAAVDQLSRPGVGAVVATGSQTGGDFGLFRGTMPTGTEVAPHFHRTFSESFLRPRRWHRAVERGGLVTSRDRRPGARPEGRHPRPARA